MRARLGLASALIATMLLARVAAAEPIGPHFELTPFAGVTQWNGDLRFPTTNPLRDWAYWGGRFGYQFFPSFAFEAASGVTFTHEDVPKGRSVDFAHLSGNAVLLPWSGRAGGPFLFVGGGKFQLKPNLSGFPPRRNAFEWGGGLRFWLSDAVGVRFEARGLRYQHPGIDHAQTDMVFGAGLTLAMGASARDTDGDGVPDRKDKCPDTPRGATVDAAGCPHDTDGDGVLDGLDKCPNTPKGCTVDASGCEHDADGDGVCDGVDKCPDTPKGATVDATGCPHDGDGDGVLDGLDKCPDTQKGCTVDSVGCSHDSDGDGVCDGLDKCPDTAAGLKVDSEGCPIEAIERETELLDTGMIRLNNVNFETGKADLLPDSYPTLDAVGTVLTKWPQLKIEIGGHTDSRGGVSYNQKLSEARAKSVRDYVVGKFATLDSSQYTVKGYGKSKPLVPNTDALNMAKNRRVEFVVLNKEVLKKEIERRRLLKKDEAAPAPAPAPAPTPAPPDTTKH